MQFLCLLALAAPALAFIATPSKPSASALNAEKSASLPFLDRPEKVKPALSSPASIAPCSVQTMISA